MSVGPEDASPRSITGVTPIGTLSGTRKATSEASGGGVLETNRFGTDVNSMMNQIS